MLSLIIPAYNEENRIRKALDSCINVLGRGYEIIVVINGSMDRTLEVVKELNKEHEQIKYLNYPEALGKGGAILEGFKYAKGDIIGFVDADDAFDIKEIKRIVDNFFGDCIIGSKWKNRKFSQIDEPVVRKILSRGWNILVRVYLGLHFKDTQAGAKFFRKVVLGSIDYDFVSKGFAFDAELLWKIKKKDFGIEEVYIPSKYIEGTTFKLYNCFLMFLDLIRMRLR